jgi:hypothetical protein
MFSNEEAVHVQYVQLQLEEPDTDKKMLLHVPVHGAVRVIKTQRSHLKQGLGCCYLFTATNRGQLLCMIKCAGDTVSVQTSGLDAKCTPWERPEVAAHETRIRPASTGEEWLCVVKAFWEPDHPGVDM